MLFDDSAQLFVAIHGGILCVGCAYLVVWFLANRWHVWGLLVWPGMTYQISMAIRQMFYLTQCHAVAAQELELCLPEELAEIVLDFYGPETLVVDVFGPLPTKRPVVVI